MSYEPELPSNAHLGNSQQHRGAVSGNAYDNATGKNLGPVAWREVPDREPRRRSVEKADPRLAVAPDTSNAVPMALVAAVAFGAVVGVAGAALVQSRKRRREVVPFRSGRPLLAPPAWYVDPLDAKQLRYWDGVQWTSRVAQTLSARTPAADWYPDPMKAEQLRYWSGTEWTQRVAPRFAAAAIPAGWYQDSSNAAQYRYWNGTTWTTQVAERTVAHETPAGWYPRPSNAAQLRYWDGTAWTDHVAPAQGQLAEGARPAAPTPDVGRRSTRQEPRSTMSSAEWQAHVRAFMAAGAIQQELWRRLSSTDIRDADPVTLEAQRRMEQLTPQEATHRIHRMLEASTLACDDSVIAMFLRSIGEGHGTDGRGEPMRIARSETRPVAWVAGDLK